MSEAQEAHRGPVTVAELRRMKRDGERIACLTAYDSTLAAAADRAGVDVLLVGDSLGMVVQGRRTTLPVRLEDVIYHTACVAAADPRALVMADMPFMSYPTVEAGLGNAGRLMKEGGAAMVKLEGGAGQTELVARLTDLGIPVCAHLGLQPQLVHKLGGYRVQGREPAAAEAMVAEARALAEAGADALLLECVPAALAEAVTATVPVPVIGIGAGPGCDGQILVLYDMLGLTPSPPRFVRDFMAEAGDIEGAIAAYAAAVRQGAFPGPEHSF